VLLHLIRVATGWAGGMRPRSGWPFGRDRTRPPAPPLRGGDGPVLPGAGDHSAEDATNEPAGDTEPGAPRSDASVAPLNQNGRALARLAETACEDARWTRRPGGASRDQPHPCGALELDLAGSVG
jgi:hypothetical protein